MSNLAVRMLVLVASCQFNNTLAIVVSGNEETTMHLSCTNALLTIHNTNYFVPVTPSWPLFCWVVSVVDVQSVVVNRCEGRSSCTVDISISQFGDPCMGWGKRLKVGYTCTCLTDYYRAGDTTCLACPRGRRVAAGAGSSAGDCKWRSCDLSSCTRDWTHDPQKPLYLILESGRSIKQGEVELRMENSGNLVLSCSGNVMWETGTGGEEVRDGLHIEESGEIVLYQEATGAVLWRSEVQISSSTIELVVGIDRVSLFDNNQNSKWARLCHKGGCVGNSCTQNGGSVLPLGMSITSLNGAVELEMKTNGDMTLVCQNTKVLWRSNTEGANVDKGLEFQNDGNLAIYSKTRAVLWQLGDSGYHSYHSGTRLVVDNIGNLIYTELATDTIIWQTHTKCKNNEELGIALYGVLEL